MANQQESEQTHSEPTQQGLTKAEILAGGQYLAAPRAIWARTDLTLTAKAVYQALLGHLRGDAREVWPGASRLCKMTACGRTAVLTAIAGLEDAGLIERERRNGARTRYRFTLPPTETDLANERGEVIAAGPGRNTPPPEGFKSGTESEPVDGENVEANERGEVIAAGLGRDTPPPEGVKSGTENGPVKDSYQSEIRTEPVRKTDLTGSESEPPTEELKEEKKEEQKKHPPTPASGGVRVFSNCPNFSDHDETVDQAVERIGRAYGEVFNRGLPWKWRRRIRREFKGGDRVSLAEIDSTAIAGAVSLAEKRQCTFGFGWVMRFVVDLAGEMAKQTEARQKRLASQNAARSHASAEIDRRQVEASAMRDYFEGLPAERQANYRAQTAAGPHAPKRDDVREMMAAAMAWKDFRKEKTKKTETAEAVAM